MFYSKNKDCFAIGKRNEVFTSGIFYFLFFHITFNEKENGQLASNSQWLASVNWQPLIILSFTPQYN